ncbi:MAG: hypothetical protein AUK16_03120 [Parcubacteria group bacterium CG2_30_44_11]|nr:MAG: hypothetical protein AUK16_03120 [Parcubacteria group bacterium CG2_30_44_11]
MDPVITPSDATTTVPRSSAFVIPASILIGFAMIAAAIYFSGGLGGTKVTEVNNVPTGAPTATTDKPIRAVDSSDHIRGNPNAQIVFVEYSDFECPFCKRFHEGTMTKLMDEYGSTGKIAWVYRHFPLEQLHPNAPKIANASECVSELAGNDGFWKFTDLIFSERETNAQTDVTKLSNYAVQAGATEAAFTTCMDEQRYQDIVTNDFTDGANAGVKGTPHTFVLFGGQQGVINGAQSYETVKQLTENLLSQLDGGVTE